MIKEKCKSLKPNSVDLKCKLCNNETDYLEIHHIIPKSRGGLDTENNLINICVDCHGLVHDVSFKRSKGIISTAIQKNKIDLIDAQKWCDDNSILIENKFDELLNKDIDRLNFISYLMLNCDGFGAINLKEFVLTDKIKIKNFII